jgi:hypothetical protein
VNIEIKTTGVKELEGKITVLQSKLDPNNPAGTLRAVMQRSLYRLQIGLATYPPQRASARWYKRTGTLGRRWTTKIDPGNPMVGRVGNNTVYAPEVQSHDYQRRSLRGYWQTDKEVLERNREIIIREFQNAIGSAVTVTFGVSTGGPD